MSVRADMHCHSAASQESKLGVQRALGLPECATPPEEVYALAKRRGMDLVTITDHDTIAGVASIADRPDVFISEELTARFRGEPQAVHVLVYGIAQEHHEWLQAHADDVEVVAAFLHEHEIACALAHPFYAVAAPLTARHRRRLAELFPVWETRNGSRAPELNQPAAVYVDTHGATGIAGSDDHAGVDIGRTWTAAPGPATPASFLTHVRAGRASAHGAQGSAAKWAHAAMALAVRALGSLDDDAAAPDPGAVLQIVERVLGEGDARGGAVGAGLCPGDARSLLRAWLTAMGFERPQDLLALMQADGFSHGDLYRRARRTHERRLRDAVAGVLATAARGSGADWVPAALGVFEASLPAIPYAPATAFLGRETSKLASREHEPVRVALVADGIGSMHGVTHTVQQIRERGVPGFDVEIIGTDRSVDRRLGAVADVDIPYYPGLQVGVPALADVVEELAEGRYGLLHLCSPGPVGVMAAMTGRMLALPTVGSYHTELTAYAGVRTNDDAVAWGMRLAVGTFYGQCDVVLSPSGSSDAALDELGIEPERIGRWARGVDTARFDPAKRDPSCFGGRLDQVVVLYAGRLAAEKGVEELADAFLAARARDPRLHLALAGEGPEEPALRARLGSSATLLGRLDGEALATAYASADLLVFPSRTDTFGQVVQEAQASGLAVIAVAAGGSAELIADGRTGLLCPPRAGALADAVCGLAARPDLRRRLGIAARHSVLDRSWEHSMLQLAAGWHRALGAAKTGGSRADAHSASPSAAPDRAVPAVA